VYKTLDMLVMGMFNVPPTPPVQAAMMDQSPEGRELVRLRAISSWDLISEWFERPVAARIQAVESRVDRAATRPKSSWRIWDSTSTKYADAHSPRGHEAWRCDD
jgi:hypothetical protein